MQALTTKRQLKKVEEVSKLQKAATNRRTTNFRMTALWLELGNTWNEVFEVVFLLVFYDYLYTFKSISKRLRVIHSCQGVMLLCIKCIIST